MPQTLLIVEDDLFTSRLIKSFFERKGFIVYQAFDSTSAYMVATDKPIDVIILDIMLPTNSGISIFNALKKIRPCPIIFYTSVSNEEMEIKALELGSDDFVNKQRWLSVLYSRIQRIISTDTAVVEVASPIIKINNITLNVELNQCNIGNTTIELQKKEGKLLNYLILNKDTLVNRDELSFILNGYSYDGWSRSIDLIVCRVRKKLHNVNIPKSSILTLRGKGYSLISHKFKPDFAENLM